ncbi:type II toxin-antitoxin system Phd/YefM family antitoxin [uncultured Desulfobacter sp.]|uniref:type II toxin-antitoxin system Phd/YefM family antitoxin n=1 Tax=uncultured Desulfobacter sp. TaxID=240139 RepID=UPI002AAB3A32|nr:type II toxin-antitoxin system Phd/YefM family antitoxin [uncultured Desulfobacter sp.]
MKTISATQFRGNIFKLLDEINETGLPIEIIKNGKTLRIIPVEKADKLSNLSPKPDVIKGDPESLVDISWEGELNLDLP